MLKALNDILLFLILFLIAFIFSGTVIAFLHGRDEALESRQEINLPYVLRNGKAIYSELKQIRATSADSISATIVLHPHLEYDSENIPLQEELVKKKDLLRKAIINWFAEKTWVQIESKKENEIKNTILKKINSNLQMGEISAIYFEEFRVIH